MGRVRHLATLLAASALVVVACAPTAPAEPVTLQVLLADDWEGAPAVRDVIDAFERDHDGAVRVQVQPVPFSQVPQVVASNEELGQPVDVAHWHGFAAAAAGLAQPVDDLWAQHALDADAYLDGALEGVTWDGRRYGVPLDTNALVLLVNVGLLADAGHDADDLATPQGFLDVADAVVRSGAADHALTVTASSWSTYGWVRALGGRLIDPTSPAQQPRFTFDDEDTVAALELLDGLIQDGLAPRPFAAPLAIDAVGSFAAGEVAMLATGSWDLQFRTRAVTTVVDDVAVAPLPQADPAQPTTVLGGSSLFVPVGSEHRELAFDLMLRLTDDEVALRLADEEGRLPARAALFEAPLFEADPLLAAFVEQLEHAEVMPLIAYPQAASAFDEALEEILAGRATPEATMTALQQRVAGDGAAGG